MLCAYEEDTHLACVSQNFHGHSRLESYSCIVNSSFFLSNAGEMFCPQNQPDMVYLHITETCNAVQHVTFEPVYEILWFDHSNETSSAVLLHGTIYFSIFYKMKFGIFLEICFLVLLLWS